MSRRARVLLLAGGALVLAVNAVVLANVAWNRGGTPESTLLLSERELAVPYLWQEAGEDSGLALSLRWRMPAAEANEHAFYAGEQGASLPANWLDAERLAALGFRLPPLPSDPEEFDWRRPPPARQLWLALELDGPAYQHSVRALEARVAEAERALAENPEDGPLENEFSRWMYTLREARETWTRLIIVDADRDRGALRARHPDRAHYAIVRGHVRALAEVAEGASPEGPRRMVWRGYVEGLDVATVHVPLAVREVFATPAGADEAGPRYEVTLAWGRRAEPWIVAARTVAP